MKEEKNLNKDSQEKFIKLQKEFDELIGKSEKVADYFLTKFKNCEDQTENEFDNNLEIRTSLLLAVQQIVTSKSVQIIAEYFNLDRSYLIASSDDPLPQ